MSGAPDGSMLPPWQTQPTALSADPNERAAQVLKINMQEVSGPEPRWL